MSARYIGSILGACGILAFGLLRPDGPSAGSDCEALSSGLLREPVAAVSSLAIVGAGWVVSRARPGAGVAVLLAGAASLAAHASAHPVARVLDGVAATAALGAVLWSIGRNRPSGRHLAVGAVIAAAGVTAWMVSRSGGPLCDAVGPWGHATWHVLIALAALVTMLTEPAAHSPAHSDGPPTLRSTNGPS